MSLLYRWQTGPNAVLLIYRSVPSVLFPIAVLTSAPVCSPGLYIDGFFGREI
jgi:hypothetical protein